MKEELEIEKKKLENQKKSNPMRGEIVREDRWKNVKLPKFLVVKFEGYTYRLVPLLSLKLVGENCIRKFNYLKELFTQKVRLLIDSLSFRSQSYSRAIAILKAKFGKPSEVSATDIQCITSLPVITNSNPNQIHEFYEKLVVSVQDLETMAN